MVGKREVKRLLPLLIARFQLYLIRPMRWLQKFSALGTTGARCMPARMSVGFLLSFMRYRLLALQKVPNILKWWKYSPELYNPLFVRVLLSECCLDRERVV